MPRYIVKVWLGKGQKEMLEEICRKLGTSNSEILRYAFMEYAKSIGVVSAKMKTSNDRPGLRAIGQRKQMIENEKLSMDLL